LVNESELSRICKLEDEARANHEREIFLDERREHLKNRVQALEESVRRLEQDIRMIEFNRRNNR
jgi:hypothetical protein